MYLCDRIDILATTGSHIIKRCLYEWNSPRYSRCWGVSQTHKGALEAGRLDTSEQQGFWIPSNSILTSVYLKEMVWPASFLSSYLESKQLFHNLLALIIPSQFSYPHEGILCSRSRQKSSNRLIKTRAGVIWSQPFKLSPLPFSLFFSFSLDSYFTNTNLPRPALGGQPPMAEAKAPARERPQPQDYHGLTRIFPTPNPNAVRRPVGTHQARDWDHRRGRYNGPSCSHKSIPVGSCHMSSHFLIVSSHVPVGILEVQQQRKPLAGVRQRPCHRPPTPSQRVQSRDCVNGSKCYNCGDSPRLTLGGISLRPTCVVHLDRRSRGYLHPRDVIGRLVISNLSRHGFIGNSSMGSHRPSPNKRALYVGGLDPRVVIEDVLRQIFETTGHVQNVKIIPDIVGGAPRSDPGGERRSPEHTNVHVLVHTCKREPEALLRERELNGSSSVCS
ncbi:uncharacterized protein B0T23DRAFT_408698 [Neurospora hispaniola]|uniref:RRM domain-containing protein n=1 Tax=Neurospora hispaniola TaxID=588809 RepID=A0AAJ0HY35_9PEZI|nr:hypothetical protein B0T23DRAFT_408698 [Neurospora hispaniola]